MKKANKGINEGRPRKTLAEKEKTGSANSTREKALQRTELKVVKLNEMPPPPDDLNEEGRRVWATMVSELFDAKVLATIDLFAVRAACIEWQCYVAHRAMQAETGSYYALFDENGGVRAYQPHPVHYNGTNHLKEFVRLANEFGLTPAARARIGVSIQDNAKTRAAELLKKLG